MHRSEPCRFVLMLLLLVVGARVLPAEELRLATDAKDAIVKIYTYHELPDYQDPWGMRGTFASSGSGCIIKGKRILTNAHVVSEERFVQVRRHGQARRYPARVVSISHAADVALLTVDDPEFFEDAEALELGELPKTQQEVLVYGFPLGGDTLSTTKGVISRIEHQTYAHSSCSFLACQIDAAINPGNSGGPAIVSNRVVGVAMQGISKADNIGYIVPATIIEHFLMDLDDGRYDGFPSLGVVMQSMENVDLKRKYGMGAKDTGMLIVKIVRGSPAESVLQEGDVLMAVEDHAVADDGTVEFRPRERTSVSYYIQAHQVGEQAGLEILRTGRRTNVTVTLNRPLEQDWLIPNERYDVVPTYYVYGGIVFCPLSLDLLKSWGPNWFDQAPEELVAMTQFNFVTDERDEVVLALKVLASDVNQGYQDMSNWVVTEVDGQNIRSLRELIGIVESDTTNTFVKFANKWGRQIVLDRKKVLAIEDQILKRYSIPFDRSPDLRGAAAGGK